MMDIFGSLSRASFGQSHISVRCSGYSKTEEVDLLMIRCLAVEQNSRDKPWGVLRGFGKKYT